MGANIGTFALLAKSEFPEAEIHCYEPSAENFRLLRLNFRINGLKGDLQQVACWGFDGKIYFRPSASNMGLVVESPPGIEVPCRLPNLSNNCWVKMDIEGSEFQVLPLLLQQPTRALGFALEVHWCCPNRTDLAALLTSRGYGADLPADPTTLCQELNYLPVS
jgi:FkbM family methyltransferase